MSDAQRGAILAFDPSGTFEYAIGETGLNPGQFALPAGLAVVANRLLVADSQNHRIQQFELLGGPP